MQQGHLDNPEIQKQILLCGSAPTQSSWNIWDLLISSAHAQAVMRACAIGGVAGVPVTRIPPKVAEGYADMLSKWLIEKSPVTLVALGLAVVLSDGKIVLTSENNEYSGDNDETEGDDATPSAPPSQPEPDPEDKDPYQTAKNGGKNYGTYKNYVSRSEKEIRKGIRSIEKQIQEHKNKIIDPKSEIENWDNLDPRKQKHLRDIK